MRSLPSVQNCKINDARIYSSFWKGSVVILTRIQMNDFARRWFLILDHMEGKTSDGNPREVLLKSPRNLLRPFSIPLIHFFSPSKCVWWMMWKLSQRLIWPRDNRRLCELVASINLWILYFFPFPLHFCLICKILLGRFGIKRDPGGGDVLKKGFQMISSCKGV